MVSSGLSCPTRDGTLSREGCAFCDLRGSSSFFGLSEANTAGPREPVVAQLAKNIPAVRNRFGALKFLAYFQSHTNTHAPPETLRSLYRDALEFPGICGLCIGTRPDCLPPETIAVLDEISRDHYVSLELGVQSFEDPVLRWLARGHDRAASLDALRRLHRGAPRVHVCVHLILGIPHQTPDAPQEAARILNAFPNVRGAKLHQLMVLEHTPLARRWREAPFPTVSLEEYADQAGAFLGHLSPATYVERLHATATRDEECLAPAWSRERWRPHNRLRELFTERGIRQGKFIQGF